MALISLFKKKDTAPIYLFNTLTKRKEEFKPIKKGRVTMYNCGPTVHNFAHIGNLRAYVFADLLKRTFEFNGYSVKQAINITDVGHLSSDADEGEDKMTKALKREGKPLTLEAMKEVADIYTKAFVSNLQAMDIKTSGIQFPRASEYIEEQIKLIGNIEKKGLTYRTSDGLYFDTTQYPEYGKLGLSGDNQQSRIGEKSEKHHTRDFALWKFNENLGWDSPWGKGFPGWHIECSAMIESTLGTTIDIHTGGIDHIPVHHNNEIAQSEAAHSSPLAHYWLHGAFLNIAGEKVAKSVGNVIYLNDLFDHSVSPLAYRYWLLGAHYSTQMDFTWEALEGAQTALIRLINEFIGWGPEIGTVVEEYETRFRTLINDNLNIPGALALVWELVKDKNTSPADKKSTLLQIDNVLGLNFSNLRDFREEKEEIPEEIKVLAELRVEARKDKDWTKADALRKEINDRGYEVLDHGEGFEIKSQ